MAIDTRTFDRADCTAEDSTRGWSDEACDRIWRWSSDTLTPASDRPTSNNLVRVTDECDRFIHERKYSTDAETDAVAYWIWKRLPVGWTVRVQYHRGFGHCYLTKAEHS